MINVLLDGTVLICTFKPMTSKQEQLEELNRKIAEESVKTIELKQLISQKMKTITEMKLKIRKMQTQKTSGAKQIDLPPFRAYDSLGEDYRDMLDEKLNLIADLRGICTEIEDAAMTAEAETDTQFHRNAELVADLQHTEYKIFQEETKRIAGLARKESLLSETRSIESSTKQAETKRTQMEDALSKVMKHADDDDINILDLQNSNHNLTLEIDDIEQQIHTANSELDRYKLLDQDEHQEHAATLSSLNTIYGFENVKKTMQDELKSIQESIKSTQQQCSALEEQTKLKQKRLSVLRSLKSKAPLDQSVPENMTVDDLISELKARSKRREQLRSDTEQEYERLVLKNNETEKLVEQEQRKLDVMMILFEKEKSDLKRKITSARQNASREEQELTQTMNDLTFKLASSPRTPLKSRIASSCGTRVQIPGSTLMSVSRVNILPSPDKMTLAIGHECISDY